MPRLPLQRYTTDRHDTMWARPDGQTWMREPGDGTGLRGPLGHLYVRHDRHPGARRQHRWFAVWLPGVGIVEEPVAVWWPAVAEDGPFEPDPIAGETFLQATT